MPIRRTGVAAALIAVVLAITACSGPAKTDGNGPGAGVGPKKLTYGHVVTAGSLDPTSDLVHPIHLLAYEGLMKLSPDGKVVPGLATEWGFLDNENKVFQLKLRENAKFSDGTPLNAAAVKAWFERVAAGKSTFIGQLGAIKSISAEDEFTVVLTLATSNPDTAYILVGSSTNWGNIASPTALAANPDALKTNTFGAGPYVLDASRTTAGDTYTYVPNKYYYDPAALNWDEVVVRVISNPATRLQSLQSGQLDAASGHFSTLATAKGLDKFKVYDMKPSSQQFVITDAGGASQPALADKRVRQAMSMAIDRAGIAAAVFGKDADPVQELASSNAYNEDAKGYSYDPKKAKALLADAGYAGGFTIKLVTQDFVGPEFVSVSQAVAQAWEEIGINVDILPSPTLASYLDAMRSDGNVIQAGVQFDRTALINYQYVVSPHGLYNSRGWEDKDLAATYQKALAAGDNTGLLRDLIDGVSDEAYVIPALAAPNGIYVDAAIGNVGVSTKRIMPYLAEWTPAK